MCILLSQKVLSSVGLFVEIIGAAIISYDYLKITDKEIDEYATLKADGGDGQKKFLKKLVLGCRIGFPLLFLGFLLQFIGNFLS